MVLTMENGADFMPLIFEGTLTDHLTVMKNPGRWGTQVELQAAADYYNLKLVFAYSPKEDSGWLVPFQQMNFPILNLFINTPRPRTTPTSSGQKFVP